MIRSNTFSTELIAAALAVFIFAAAADARPFWASTGPAPLAAAAYEPFQHSSMFILQNGYSGALDHLLIPKGKMFVAEHVSLSGRSAPTQPMRFSILTKIHPDSTWREHYFAPVKENSDGMILYSLAQPVKIYADGPSLRLQVQRASGLGQSFLDVTVSGYFVDR